MPIEAQKSKELARSLMARQQLALFGAQALRRGPAGDRHAQSPGYGPQVGRCPERITTESLCRSLSPSRNMSSVESQHELGLGGKLIGALEAVRLAAMSQPCLGHRGPHPQSLAARSVFPEAVSCWRILRRRWRTPKEMVLARERPWYYSVVCDIPNIHNGSR